MEGKRKVSQVFNNNQESWLGRTNDRWWNCLQDDINKWKITNWKERSKKQRWLEDFL
jgi:hypothetical protein